MQISNETKGRIRALYYRQIVLSVSKDATVIQSNNPAFWDYSSDTWYLLLTPLRLITPEHQEIINSFGLYPDILRQLGYATEFIDIVDGKPVMYSVSDMVSAGIIKLREG